MSRITEKSAVGSVSPFVNISTGVPAQQFSSNPATGTQPSSGVGYFDPQASSYLGQKFDTSDGRELVFVQNGAVAIGAGRLAQTAAEITAFEGLAMTVPTAYPATAGLKQILVTNGATVLKANQFVGGFAIVATGTGAGQMFKISSHAPAANAATFVLTLEDPIQTTLDTSSKITLQFNPYNGVLIVSHSGVATPVGVTIYGIAASTAPTFDGTSGALTANGVAQYGYLVTHGPTACLIDTTTTVGYPLGPAVTNYDGALEVATLTTSPQVAISLQTQTSNKYGLVYMQL